eukprot:CAMPEP_0196660384 /NCGR_PEP_ID=MMETSP1086-20130531/39505_1 /TAXON_ID=77921 /ORGANISM="Cyanoptyche  gloeocystis , Strain SAG4.97" /LENGTH=303 /DNA_ID=CAMNT_0041994767 /DNA_START=223 /DNA_END=1134 /DNA_ORIENTATION=+
MYNSWNFILGSNAKDAESSVNRFEIPFSRKNDSIAKNESNTDGMNVVYLPPEVLDELLPLSASPEQIQLYLWKDGEAARYVSLALLAFVGALSVQKFNIIPTDLLYSVAVGSSLMYWIFGPMMWASRRNNAFRQVDTRGEYRYGVLLRGTVAEMYETDKLLSTHRRLDPDGRKVVRRKYQKWLKLVVSTSLDLTVSGMGLAGARMPSGSGSLPLAGWEIIQADAACPDATLRFELKAPTNPKLDAVEVGDPVEVVMLLRDVPMADIGPFTDAYLPRLNAWFGSYPHLSRPAFLTLRRTAWLNS